MCDTEERKNKQIDDMKRKHDRAFTEIKNYYNDITLNNLAMISTLKEEIKSKEEKLERNEQVGWETASLRASRRPKIIKTCVYTIAAAGNSATGKQETSRAPEKGQRAAGWAAATTWQPGKGKVSVVNYSGQAQNRQEAGGELVLGVWSIAAETGQSKR